MNGFIFFSLTLKQCVDWQLSTHLPEILLHCISNQSGLRSSTTKKTSDGSQTCRHYCQTSDLSNPLIKARSLGSRVDPPSLFFIGLCEISFDGVQHSEDGSGVTVHVLISLLKK